MHDDFESRLRNAFGLVNEQWETVDRFEQNPFSDRGGHIEDRLQELINSLTTVGAEVSRLRAEMDGLQDENCELKSRVTKLHAVIQEKNLLNMDEFELACDVIQAESTLDTGFDRQEEMGSKSVLH